MPRDRIAQENAVKRHNEIYENMTIEQRRSSQAGYISVARGLPNGRGLPYRKNG